MSSNFSYDHLEVTDSGQVIMRAQYWDGIDKRDWNEIDIDNPERLRDDLEEAIQKKTMLIKEVSIRKVNLLTAKKAEIERELEMLTAQIAVQEQAIIPEKTKKAK